VLSCSVLPRSLLYLLQGIAQFSRVTARYYPVYTQPTWRTPLPTRSAVLLAHVSVDWGPERETVQFYHKKVDQRVRNDVMGWSFQDDGEWWVVLELGYAITLKKLFIFYIKRDHISAIFPGRVGDTPTFTEVFGQLEAQTRDIPEEQRAETEELPLDKIQWSPLVEARRYKWLPEKSAQRGAATQPQTPRQNPT
jgi:hypothetical protein